MSTVKITCGDDILCVDAEDLDVALDQSRLSYTIRKIIGNMVENQRTQNAGLLTRLAKQHCSLDTWNCTLKKAME